MLQIKSKTECCGCTACKSVCPKQCIEMKEDIEGFLYPDINLDNCVKCGLCEKVCPVINKQQQNGFEQVAYIVQNKNEQVLRESTAGGAFTAIAKYALDNEGVVFGVEFTKDNLAQHIYVENETELVRFRNSKYIQSNVGNTYREAEKFLKCGKEVVFSGTPCQIEGLKRYLRNDYSNLITVDVVCRAVPSPLIFRKYMEYQEHRLNDTIKTVYFRDKYYGYKYSTMNVVTDRNQGKYHKGVESDPWLRAFFSNICDRPSCHECRFRDQYRVSDITIWDCFHINRFSKILDNDKGATRMLIHTQKGKDIFAEIRDNFFYVETTPEALVEGSREMQESVVAHEKRKKFFEDANQMDGIMLFEKYFPETFKVIIERSVRLLCYKLGIYSFAKRLAVRILRKY